MTPRYPYVHVLCVPDGAEDLSVLLFELGASGVEERDQSTLSKSGGDAVLLIASFDTEEAAKEALVEISRTHEATLEHVEGDAWRDAWREHFKPTPIGERLLLRPSWEPVPESEGRVVLTLDPGRAFGSGTHETTRLVLHEVERVVRGGEEVLDVGCGSGILGVAALLLGAAKVIAIDVDADSVEVTIENATLNGVSERLVASEDAIETIDGTYPLVLANIEPRVLVPMAKDLSARVAKGGLLVLSGILVTQKDDVLAAYSSFQLLRAPVMGEWTALVMAR